MAGLLLIQQQVEYVYDYTTSSYNNLSGIIEEGNIRVYDYGEANYITGQPTNLYDYATNSYVMVEKHGDFLAMYSYHYARYFTARKNANIIMIHDSDTCQYYNYLIG